MIVVVAADHAGVILREVVAQAIAAGGHHPLVLGADLPIDPFDDYPDVAQAVGRAILEGAAERGVLVCGSGAGVSVAANKMRGIRAGVAHETYTAHQMVEHDDVNVLALGGRVIGPELAAEVVRAFVGARFSAEERHQRRVRKILRIEREGE